jgi:hypothetical protein
METLLYSVASIIYGHPVMSVVDIPMWRGGIGSAGGVGGVLHTHQSPERLTGAQLTWLNGELGHQVSAMLSINSSISSLETLNRAAV